LSTGSLALRDCHPEPRIGFFAVRDLQLMVLLRRSDSLSAVAGILLANSENRSTLAFLAVFYTGYFS